MKVKPGWILAVAAFIHLTVTYGTISSFVVLFVSLEEEFESSAVATGWMGSMAWGVAALFSPFSAIMFLRWGHRPIACLGVLCCSVGLLVTSFLSNLWYMYVSFGFVFAAGTNMLNNSCFHLVALHFPGKKGVRPFAFINLSGGVALLAGTALLDVCIKALGWRLSYAIFSGIIFVVCLPLCYFYKQPSPCNHDNGSTNEEKEKCVQLKADSSSTNKKGMFGVELEQQPVRTSSLVCLASATYGCESTQESGTETTTNCKYKQLEDGNKTKASSLGMKVLFRNFQRRHHADSASDRPTDMTQDEPKTLSSKDTSCTQKRTAPSNSGSTAGDVEHDSDNASSDELVMEVSDHIVNSKDESCLNRKCAFVKVPGVWMATFGTLTTTVASVFNVINLVSYMQMIGLKDRISVLLIMGLGLAEMFGRILFFLIGSSLPVAGITTMAVVNLAGAGLSLCLALVPKLATIIVYIVVAGMARGIFYTINLPSCLELFKGLDSAVVITLMMVGNGLGGLFSSTCAGLSVDITGSYKAAFFTCTGLYFTSFILFGSLRLWPGMFIPDKPQTQAINV